MPQSPTSLGLPPISDSIIDHVSINEEEEGSFLDGFFLLFSNSLVDNLQDKQHCLSTVQQNSIILST